MAELHGRRIAAVFAADSQLDVRTGLTAQISSHLHQLANALLIQTGKGIRFINFFGIIRIQELASVI